MTKIEKTVTQYELGDKGFVVEVIEDWAYDNDKGEFADLLLFYLFHRGYGDKAFLGWDRKTNNDNIEETIYDLLALNNYIPWYRENVIEKCKSFL